MDSIKARLREIAEEIDRIDREFDAQQKAYNRRLEKLRAEQDDLNNARGDAALGRDVKVQMDASALRAWSDVRL